MGKNNLYSLVFTFFALLSLPVVRIDCVLSHADRVPKKFYVNPSTVPDNQVEFWKLIFAKYGKNDYVFHYRDYPNIIYSVLDFSGLHAKYGNTRTFENHRQAEVNSELRKIRAALQNLAKGKTAKSSLEKRIEKLFAPLGSGTRKYQLALADKQVRYQPGIKERFREGIARSSRYLWAMEKIFKEEGLPVELTRLPLVESTFDYEAYSSVGAAGIWQFMKATGRSYLIINDSVDERRDPILTTRAAAKYLSHAYDKIGDWPLALTSYNHGVNGILRAMKNTGRRDLKTIVERYQGSTFGFASKNFYSEFAAALEIEQNYKKYFPDLKREKPLPFDEFRLNTHTPFATLVRHSGLSTEEFNEMNPAFLKRVRLGYVPVPRGAIVRVPENRAHVVIAKLGGGGVEVGLDEGAQVFLAQLEARKKWSEFVPGGKYKVRAGDTLSEIARKHSVSTRKLILANNISNPGRLSIGQNLLIPDQSTRNYASSSSSSTAQSYTVRSGDNLYNIARRHGTNVSNLKKLNPSAGRNIFPGQKLRIK